MNMRGKGVGTFVVYENLVFKNSHRKKQQKIDHEKKGEKNVEGEREVTRTFTQKNE